MKKTFGLRTEILLTLTLLLGAALLLGGVMMLRLAEQTLLEERVEQLDSITRVLARSLIVSGDNAALLSKGPKILEQLPDGLNCEGWWLYDQTLGLVDSIAATGKTPLSISSRQQVKLSGELQRIVTFPSLLSFWGEPDAAAYFSVPLIAKNRFSGVLELSFSLADIRWKLLKSQQVVILYVLLYGFVLVLIGYYLLQRNIISPARSLLKATENVGMGNLETRLPLSGPAEIAQLAAAFNHMVDALRMSRQETGEYIDSLQKSNEELQQARDELIRSEKMASVGQLAAGLAHEVGNPLAALIGYLEVLKQKAGSTADLDILDRSLVETTRIDFLVRELLDFSRSSDGELVEEVDLITELRASIHLLQNQGSFGELKLTDHLPDSLYCIGINRHKLQQVFVNLLLNAVQACRQSGEISVSAGEDGQVVWLGIKDNGCGIPENQLNKIFDPFYTTKQPGEGTGLGLTICHRIVEEAGGRIEVDSSFGRGSFFKLCFPKITG